MTTGIRMARRVPQIFLVWLNLIQEDDRLTTHKPGMKFPDIALLIVATAALFCGCSSMPEKSVLADHNGTPELNPEVKAPTPDAPPAPLRMNPNTTIQVRLLQTISSRTAASGNAFDAELAAPIRMDGTIIFSKGTRLRGHVVSARPSGRLHNPGSLSLTLDSIQDLNGKWVPLSTTRVSARAKGHDRRNLTLIGGGTGVGALIGGIAGGGKGAAIGAASGAAAGTAGAYATGLKDVVFPAEKKLTFRTLRETVIQR